MKLRMMKEIRNITKNDMPPTEGRMAGFHRISFVLVVCLTPSVCENFNRIELKTKESMNVIPMDITTNNKILF